MSNEYYRLDNILKTESEYNILLSGRATGKSYAVKEYCLRESLKNDDSKFVYVRRFEEEVKKKNVESYFRDIIPVLVKITKNEYNDIEYISGTIWAVKYDEEGKKTENKKKIGYAVSLSSSGALKSMTFPDVYNFIFEEFIAEKFYLTNEIDAFFSVLSTVARRNRLRVFMIGNTISRNCLYFNEFALFNVPKQKAGTIEIYKQKTNPVQYDEDGKEITLKIAVEMINIKTNAKMFFGQKQSSITNSAWSCSQQPKINLKEFEKLYEIHKIVFEYRLSKFLAIFYVTDTGDGFWYVQPKTTRIFLNTRVITDKYTSNPLYTYNLKPLNENEQKLFIYFKNKKIYFSDNLTGSEFIEALRFFNYNTN